jgi:chromosome segregation protein
VHLKSLTLRGFKSFASSTTLHFEPGITCVVGPNGSGKSNVVDAIAWVMGEQGAKSLRGGKMEDVIFAGTAGRPPLGRAEVVLTIDNTDGALPIDYTEVTISRIMFRSGGSEYAINGTPCRLLDVQELLSDSGIGREMHVIVGQGQLDSILHATPEDRRGFIEEAAGVLKHRKRKEKAQRKLDGLSEKMSRLTDLTAELRRQLKPLGRQAEVARRAAIIQADVRDARLRLLADDLEALTSALAKDQADETALREQRQEAEAQLLADQAREAQIQSDVEQLVPALNEQQDVWFRLSGVAERFRAIGSVARERSRNLTETDPVTAGGVDPHQLESEAHRLQEELADLATRNREHTQELAAASAGRAAAESDLAAEERRVEQAQRSAAERRERLARLQGSAAAARSRIETRQGEIDRLEAALGTARQRGGDAAAQFAALEQQVSGLDTGEVDLDSHYEQCNASVAAASDELSELIAQETAAQQERATVAARVDALRSAVRSRSGLPEDIGSDPDVLGLLRDHITVQPGWETGVTAALGELADGVVVASHDTALQVLGRIPAVPRFLITNGRQDGDDHPEALAGVVSGDPAVVAALTTVLAGIRRADSVPHAAQLVAAGARLAVTADGHVVGPTSLVAWDDNETSALELAARIDADEVRLAEAVAECERLRFALEQARHSLATAESDLAAALTSLHESDAAMAAVADQLGALGSRVRAARHESERLESDVAAARQLLIQDQAALTTADAELRQASDERIDAGPVADRREQLSAGVATARATEMEVRLALRTGEERAAAMQRRAEELLAAADRERAAAVERERVRQRRSRQRQVALAVESAAAVAVAHADRLVALADEARLDLQRRRDECDTSLGELRVRIKELTGVLETLTDSVHRDEMVRTEQRLKIQQLQDRAMADHGIDTDALVAEYGPHVQIPPSPRAPGDEEDGGPEPQPYAFERGEQERRLKSAERALSLLGRVNPLALEEFAALEERHQFLSAQLDDIRNARDDLHGVIKEVDDRMEQVFAEAFADTAAQFERVFARLFPGGDGRLVLTDPHDMLATGVEVEARPPGKKVKRLSLLSGGERSLTAVAFLVALFKARPSPFYVLDEVEAALDDTNLGRLLEVIEELRSDSQLIVITHQKRTMEAADALYGVSMRGDGVSNVISQRIRDTVDA